MAVLPLRAILLQILFLTIAIAIESFVLHRKLYLSRRTSIEYAASLNLFSTIFGWAIFFLVNPFLGIVFQHEIINYILFGRFATLEFSLIRIWLDVLAFMLFTFLLIFSVERSGLYFLLDFSTLNINNPFQKRVSETTDRQKQPASGGYISNRTKSNIILLANVYSQSLILLILFILKNF